MGVFRIQFNVNPYQGCVQFLFDITIDNEDLDLSWGMWESITEELLGLDNYTRKLVFSSLE